VSTIPSDMLEAVKIAEGTIPVVVALATAISKVMDQNATPEVQLDALQTAAEAVKRKMDQLKFPNESET
jgi:hypothetical protein